MAENHPPPDFDSIATATAASVSSATVMNTELPRLRTFQGIQGTELILQELRNINRRLHRMENQHNRSYNSRILADNPAAILLPLQDPQTADPIPNCPRTLSQVKRLPPDEARRTGILEAARRLRPKVTTPPREQYVEVCGQCCHMEEGRTE